MRKKLHHFRKATIAILFSLMICAQSFTISSLNRDSGRIEYQITVGTYEILQDDQGFDYIHMLTPGYENMDSPGDPTLPAKLFEFLVPNNINWSTVVFRTTIIDSEILRGIYNIRANPSYLIGEEESWGEEKSIVNGKNTYVYNKDANYPEQSIEMCPYTQRKEPVRGEFENHSYIRVTYRPFLYNPVQQKLTLIRTANITITYSTDPGKPPGGEKFDYVIITTRAVVTDSEELDHFIYLKELYGHNVLVVTEDDYGELTGQPPNGRAEKIREWLMNNYAGMQIDYVLLIGGPDPDDPFNASDYVGTIPMKHCWSNLFYPQCFEWESMHGVPTDYFYADLTGDWDLDGDMLFGESYSIDHANSPDPLIDEDTFSVEWKGKIQCDFDKEYEFKIYSDDGVKLVINGTTVIDDWGVKSQPTNNYGFINLTSGKYNISLKYHEHIHHGIIRFYWRNANNDMEIVPEDHLYDLADVPNGLDAIYYDNEDFTGVTATDKDNVIDFFWGTGDRGPGGPDTGADVFVGRIPVYNHNITNLDKILKKIINYETDSGNISWRKSVLLPMHPLASNTPAYHYGEEIRNNFALADGFSCYRIYDDDYSSVGGPTPEDWPCTNTKVRNEWKNGYGFVTWWTHGAFTYASSVFYSGDLLYLNDSKPAFTFQNSCGNGYPEVDYNLGYELLKHGAITTVPATRISFGSRGNWTYNSSVSSNPTFGYAYARYVIHDGQTSGVALYLAKAPMTKVTTNHCNYNLNGDPETYLLFTIPNYPPVADAGGPYSEYEGTPVEFDASLSYDPDGDPLQYRWDFDNDGIWDTDWLISPTTLYTFGDDYIGTSHVETIDATGRNDSCNTSIVISNIPPILTVLSMDQPNPQFILPVVHTLTFTANFSDPGWLDTHISIWEWDDGTEDPGTITEEHEPPDATGITTADHAYENPGTYQVTVTIRDDEGEAASADIMVIVVDEYSALQDLDDYIQNLSRSSYKNLPRLRQIFLRLQMNMISKLLYSGSNNRIVELLLKNIRKKADGSIDGNPSDDWIIDEEAQAHIYLKVNDLLAYLQYINSLS